MVTVSTGEPINQSAIDSFVSMNLDGGADYETVHLRYTRCGDQSTVTAMHEGTVLAQATGRFQNGETSLFDIDGKSAKGDAVTYSVYLDLKFGGIASLRVDERN